MTDEDDRCRFCIAGFVNLFQWDYAFTRPFWVRCCHCDGTTSVRESARRRLLGICS